jgi:hypothetical protein
MQDPGLKQRLWEFCFYFQLYYSSTSYKLSLGNQEEWQEAASFYMINSTFLIPK